VDGLSVGGSGAPETFNFANAAIGGIGSPVANTFYGTIDEVGFYNRILSPAEIQSIYNAGAYGLCWMPAPPFILTQPTSKIVVVGSPTMFSVTVAGWMQSLGFQWLFNGTGLVGMTNNLLLIANAQQNKAGNYSVVITNAYGSVTSSVVSLTVTGASQYTAYPTSGQVPLAVQFNCPGTDSGGNPIVQWSWNFGDGATSALQNPTHVFATDGTFYPSFIATNNLSYTVLGSGPPVTANMNNLVVNGGFERDDFSGWTLSGDTYWTVVDDGSESSITPHSGSYEAALGTLSSLGYLSQTMATRPGTNYWLSCWLNHAGGDPNDIFIISWNGTKLLDETNLPAPAWTNYQFVVSATGTSSVLQFGFAASGVDYLDLDDISVVAFPTLAQPRIAGVGLSGSNLVINGTNGVYGRTYYVLSATNLSLPKSQWSTVTTNVLTANGIFTLTATNAVNPSIPQAFYILQAQ
jgi:PKD repeat protein